MSYWNPSTVPNNNPNQNYLNPHPQLATQATYNQNYNAVGNQLMSQIAPQNAAINEMQAIQQQQTGLQNQLIDTRTADASAQNNAQAQINAIRLGGIPAEKAWRESLKRIAQQAYNVESGTAKQGYSEGLANLYEQAGAQGATVSSGARRRRGDLQTQLDLGLKGADVNLQTAYANHTHYMQQLDQDAKIYGVNRDTLQQGMEAALKTAGLEKQVNLAQLAADMKSNDIKKADNAQTVWQQLALYAQANPQAFMPTPAQKQSASQGHKVMQERVMGFWDDLNPVNLLPGRGLDVSMGLPKDVSIGGGSSPWGWLQKHNPFSGSEEASAAPNTGNLQDQLVDQYGVTPALAQERAAYVNSLPPEQQQAARDALIQEAQQYKLSQLTPLGADRTAAQTGATMRSLVDQVLPPPPRSNPAMLMNAQAQFMAPYLSHLENMAPETKAAYAQQAMTFPLAYQIQQQVAHSQNVNDLRSQALGGLLGQYYSNQASSAASPDLLAGSTGS